MGGLMVRVLKLTPAWVAGGRAEVGMGVKSETRDAHQRADASGVISGIGEALRSGHSMSWWDGRGG